MRAKLLQLHPAAAAPVLLEQQRILALGLRGLQHHQHSRIVAAGGQVHRQCRLDHLRPHEIHRRLSVHRRVRHRRSLPRNRCLHQVIAVAGHVHPLHHLIGSVLHHAEIGAVSRAQTCLDSRNRPWAQSLRRRRDQTPAHVAGIIRRTVRQRAEVLPFPLVQHSVAIAVVSNVAIDQCVFRRFAFPGRERAVVDQQFGDLTIVTAAQSQRRDHRA